MTLDEAIIHAKGLSASQSVCKDCREEHKQLATWLEELKQYKEQNQLEKTAEEMFKKLGYKYVEESDERYNYKVIKYYDTYTEFVFSINLREFAVSYCEDPKYITVDEFKAIQQQMKELEWI